MSCNIHFKSVEKLVCGHSYFTTSPESLLVKKRNDLHTEAVQYKVGFWQSEYCILGGEASEVGDSRGEVGGDTCSDVGDSGDGNACFIGDTGGDLL